MPMLFWRRRGNNWRHPLVAAAAVVPVEAEAMAEERSRRSRLLPFHCPLQRLLIQTRMLPPLKLPH